jgi:D-3-phosphoglycerate dehydrogenase
MTKKALITDYAWPSLEIEAQILKAVDAELIVAETGDEAELVELAPLADAILTCWKPVTPAVLDVAERCLVVNRYGIGLDNIAVDHATQLGMLVTNVPEFCLEEVSDQAIALLLACARGIVRHARATRVGTWDLKSVMPVPRLRGQTLGLIGYGNIARALVPKALGFGLEIMAYTPRLASDTLAGIGRATNDLDLLLRESDYISIHAPLTAETQNLIDARALQIMKPSAYLINTSRGAIIDEGALYQALTEGWIAGAGLDVLIQEPPDPAQPLLALDNVVVTPHTGFYSETAIEELARGAAQQTAQVFRGELPTNIVNPVVMSRPNYRLAAFQKNR